MRLEEVELKARRKSCLQQEKLNLIDHRNLRKGKPILMINLINIRMYGNNKEVVDLI